MEEFNSPLADHSDVPLRRLKLNSLMVLPLTKTLPWLQNLSILWRKVSLNFQNKSRIAKMN